MKSIENMKPVATFNLVLVVLGCGLLILGFGLGLLFGSIEIPASGPGGVTVAVLFGIGFCVVLFTALHRMISVSGLPESSTLELSESSGRRRLPELREWRAKLAIYFSAAATVLAFALFCGGVPVAFIGFNFATGVNDVGLIMILTGMVVGVVAIVGGFITIILGWGAARTTGNFYWLYAAIAVPIFQVLAYLVGTYFIKSL